MSSCNNNNSNNNRGNFGNPFDHLNTSNATDTLPERLELHLGQSHLDDMVQRPAATVGSTSARNKQLLQQGPGKELNAASALADLVNVDDDEKDEDDFEIPQRFTKSGRKKATPFPVKLMKVLSRKDYSDTITWLPDGKSFTIVRPKAFVADILPSHFKQAKYSSFTRKLHRWGFQRHLRGDAAGAFFHKLFQRGRLDLVEKMTCYRYKTEGSKQIIQAIKEHDVPQGAVPYRSPLLAESVFGPQQMPQHHPPAVLAQHDLSPMYAPDRTLRQFPPTQKADPSLNTMDRLNAAIEIEVNRRLKERVNAASLPRQSNQFLFTPATHHHHQAPLSPYHNPTLASGTATYGNFLGGRGMEQQQQQPPPPPQHHHQMDYHQPNPHVHHILSQQGQWNGATQGFDIL